jgi:haloacid dehalogenase superfamily, subfamily IA, variant 1 with third motif having Dx(3-4)D or Dx(3-4)E
MPGRIRAIGFDLGETLLFYRDMPLSWATKYPEALAAVAKSCGVKPTAEQFALAGQILTQHNTRVVPRTQEIPAATILASVLEAWRLEVGKHTDTAIEAFFSFFQQHMCAYPETMEVIQTLRTKGIPTGILTDVPYGMPRSYVQRDLEGAGISKLFDVVLTSVEVGVRKPEPAGYSELAKRLGVELNQMLYVGNEAKDVIGARQARVLSALLDRNGTGEDHGQNFTLSTLTNLYDILFPQLKPKA